MLLAAFLFATMGVCIKFASVHFNSFEIVTYRGLVGVLFLWGFTRARGVSLRTAVLKQWRKRHPTSPAVATPAAPRWVVLWPTATACTT